MEDAIEIKAIDTLEAETALADLIALLQDAVESGASVGFLAPLGEDQASIYWRERFEEVTGRKRVLLVARHQGHVVGSVQLALASQPNGSHRAEVQRLIVLRSHQQRGIGSRLMRYAEQSALKLGRTLLVLNTRTGDPPEALYLRLGYQVVGHVPGFARNPDGTLNTTTIMYRHLSPV